MGCTSSKESDPAPQAPRAITALETRATNATPSALQSQTPLTQLRPSVANARSNVSTPRASTTSRFRSTRGASSDVPVSEQTNTPLQVPKPWKSTDRTWTRTQLRREREDFFMTQVTGHRETWDAIQQVAELLRQHNLADAQGIMDAAGITSPTGRLEEGAYDERGVLYRLPIEVVTDPQNVMDDDNETVVGNDDLLNKKLDIEKEETEAALTQNEDKGKDAVERDAIKVRCRLSDRGGQDVNVLVSESAPIGILIKRLRSEAAIASSAKVRIAYMGKILNEQKTLNQENWVLGHVVQVLVSNVAPP